MKNKTTMSKTIARFAFFAMCSFPLMGAFQSKAQVINTLAGTGSAGYSGDGGAATAAAITTPSGVAVDASGSIYFSDPVNSVIRKVTTAGAISTVAGTGTSGYNGDGIAATAAQLYAPKGITFDASGNMYFADQLNQRIRKIDVSGTISTVAGSGYQGFWGDGGSAVSAGLSYPTAVAFDDATGSLYIADALNSRVRKVDAGGTINTYGDGGFATPIGVCMGGGELYVSEWSTNRVSKVNLTTGSVTRLVGSSVAGYSGNGGAASSARLHGPTGVAYDASGNLFITDGGNHVIRKVTPSGIISTYAGTTSTGYNGDGINALTATMEPDLIALDAAGNIMLCDAANNRLRFISTHTPSFAYNASASLSLCQNSVAYPINTVLRMKDIDAGETLTISVVSGPSHGSAAASYTATATGGYITPTGLSYTPATGYTGSDAITVKVSDGNTSSIITINFTVNPAPSAPVISGASSVCLAGTTTLTASPAGGIWGATDGNSTVGSATGIVTGTGGGNTTIYYNSPYNAYGCRTQSRTTLAVIGTPSAGTLTGASSVCPGASATLSSGITGGSWSSSNAAIATVAPGGIYTAIASGVANISYTVSNGCYSSTAVKIVTVTGPTVPGPIGGVPYLYPGATQPMTNSLSGGIWSTSDSSVAPITSSGIVLGYAVGSCTIYYAYTNGCGITSTVSKNITVLSGYGRNAGHVQEATIAGGFTIFPNPTSGVVTLEVGGATGNMDVTVYDIAGKTIRTINSGNTKAEIDFSGLQSGTYIIKAFNAGNAYTGKVLVQ